MNLAAFWAELLPPLLALLAALIGLVLRNAEKIARERWGIEIEARHREALHSALMTGIAAALTRGAGTRAAIAEAIDYATRSVPDAITALDPAPETLQALAEAKLRQAITATVIGDGAARQVVTRVGTP